MHRKSEGSGREPLLVALVAPYLLVLMTMVPWALLLLLLWVLPASRAYTMVWSEATGIAIMVGARA